MFNYVLKISYNGKNYSGWQVQKNKITVQGVLQNAIVLILNQQVKLVASGRTDAGVSAIKQVANFTTQTKIKPAEFMGRLNNLLPSDIRVLNCYEVEEQFNARFSAKQKTYAYNFYLSKISIPYYDQFATMFKQNVNMNIFAQNANMLLGTHDYTSFCASNTQVVDKVRQVSDIKLVNNGGYYTLLITGNGFLYNMVRIIMGTLIDISCGKLKQNINQIISEKNRTKAGFTASACGLVLVDVVY